MSSQGAASIPSPSRRSGGGGGAIVDLLALGAVAPGEDATGVLREFVREPSPLLAVSRLLGSKRLQDLAAAAVDPLTGAVDSRAFVEQLLDLIAALVADIDEEVSRQVDAILHHGAFQRLEATWRGVEYLVDQADADDEGRVQIRLLDVSWKELSADLARAVDFDQSQLFQKVYEEEFGRPGGEPFGVLIGDYEVQPTPDHLDTLRQVSGIAAAAFAPFVAAAHPSFFGVQSFTQLDQVMDLGRLFEGPDYVTWRSLRKGPDTRFVGLTVPKVLLRLPYDADAARTDGFAYREEVEVPAGSPPERYLWGNGAYAFGGVVIRAFIDHGWLADIRGFDRGLLGRGLVSGLPCPSYETDTPGVALRGCTDLMIDDDLEQVLDELGFIPLCQLQDAPYAAFFSNQSIHEPQVFNDLEATMNARISAMLQYMLCVSRFAHYLKVLARDKVGSFGTPGDLQSFLHRWVYQYVVPDQHADDDTKRKYPLGQAEVTVTEDPRDPGNYLCTMLLKPHYQLDAVAACIKLATELSGEGS